MFLKKQAWGMFIVGMAENIFSGRGWQCADDVHDKIKREKVHFSACLNFLNQKMLSTQCDDSLEK